ncbi:uncharacterized protein LOC144861539 [Branchiostoma floridae x Branchiostoma japonicum]
MTLPPPTRHVDHSSLRGLDLARFSRKDQTNKGTVDSIHSATFTAKQVQTALRQVRKTEQRVRLQLQSAREDSEAQIHSMSKQVTMLKEEKEKAQKVLLEHKVTVEQLQNTEQKVSQLESQLQSAREESEAQIHSMSKQVTMLKEEKEKAQQVLLEHKVTIEQLQNTEQKVNQLESQLQTAKEGSGDLIHRLSKQVTMLTEENEKAQKDLLENKTTIEQLQDINKTRVDIIEKMTAENTKLSNRNDNLQHEVRTLRENIEALQKLLSEKTQELQLAQETSEETAAKPESLFGQQKGKQTMERQNQADDSKRKEKQPAPEEFSSEASKEEQTGMFCT